VRIKGDAIHRPRPTAFAFVSCGARSAKILAFFLIASWFSSAIAASQVTPGTQPDDTVHAQTAIDVLQQWYNPESGLYRTTGWWNSANAITALANYSRIRHSTAYLPVFANTLRAAQSSHEGAPGFLNKFYDDEGWWALAWIDVYDLTGDRRYLRIAATIFADMQLGWDAGSCGGGLWWSKDKRDKNAIENELFLAVAASLANREESSSARKEDLSWALKEWGWFQASGMINSEDLVNDGLDFSDPAHCRNNGKTTWTYNQGVILGALVELNKAQHDPRLEKAAAAIAASAIEHLTDAHDILREPNNAHSGGDVPQFKGIFVRNLMLLNQAFPDSRYRSFILTNARSAWSADRDVSNHFGFWWGGPFDIADAARQSSAADLLIAAATLGTQGQNEAEDAPRDSTNSR
jgi:predicted alpha-1,6-mannanase (GH76 family)